MAAIGWVLLIIAVIALAIFLIAFLFSVLIASLAALVAGTVAGYFVLLVVDWTNFRKLSNLASLSSVASLRITSAGLSIELLDSKVKEWTKSNNLNWLATLAAGGMAFVAIYLGIMQQATSIYAYVSSGWLPAVQFCTWAVPVILMSFFAKGAGRNRWLGTRLRKHGESLATRLKSRLSPTSTLEMLENRAAGLATSFKIDWHTQYCKSLERYVELNHAHLLVNSASAEELLRALIALATLDCERLEQAKNHWSAVWTRYEKLAALLRFDERPTLARQLDEYAMNLPKFALWLSNRQWDAFSAALTDADGELQMLERNVTAPEQPLNKSPYEVLGVSPDMPLEEIKEVYLNLVKQLHPDLIKRGNATERAVTRLMQDINVAWEEIERTHDRNKQNGSLIY